MNIPFELIFIVLFFVLPALSSLVQRRRGGQQPPPENPERSPRPKRPGPSANTDTRSETANTSTSTTTRDVPRWLEEAQRRVREAQQSESDRQGGRGQPQPARPQSTQTSTSQQPRTTPPRPAPGRSSLEDYRPKAVSLERTTTLANREPVPSTLLPTRAQQANSKNPIPGSYKMRFDRQTLMTGFIWHQVLSPPLSKTRRTRLSRRRP